jgi:hypothetical protein
MTGNPIVDEVHRIRKKILASYGGDLHALVADVRRQTEEAARAGRKVISPAQLRESEKRRARRRVGRRRKTGNS